MQCLHAPGGGASGAVRAGRSRAVDDFPMLRRELVTVGLAWRPEAVTLESPALRNEGAPDLSSCASSAGCARSFLTTMTPHLMEAAPTLQEGPAFLGRDLRRRPFYGSYRQGGEKPRTKPQKVRRGRRATAPGAGPRGETALGVSLFSRARAPQHQHHLINLSGVRAYN